jgi:hypothetical protein
MHLFRRFRFSMATIMMFVVMSAAAMALFTKIQHLADDAFVPTGWKLDAPTLFLLAIFLTSVALGSWKEHTAVQIMIQVTLACVSCLTLIWIGEAKYERGLRYWCQATFAASVTLPMLARRFVKSGMARGPKREWWKKTCEAVFFSFLTMLLVSAGGLLQFAVYTAASALPIQITPVPPPAMPLPPAPPIGPGPPTGDGSVPEMPATAVHEGGGERPAGAPRLATSHCSNWSSTSRSFLPAGNASPLWRAAPFAASWSWPPA